MSLIPDFQIGFFNAWIGIVPIILFTIYLKKKVVHKNMVNHIESIRKMFRDIFSFSEIELLMN